MPAGQGTYGAKVGRPSKKKRKGKGKAKSAKTKASAKSAVASVSGKRMAERKTTRIRTARVRKAAPTSGGGGKGRP